MRYIYSTILAAFLTANVYAQAVNAYGKVTNLSGNTINVANINETNDTFEDGEFVIVMQMQDDVIGANTSNNSSFGNLSSIESAGLYDIVDIVSHTESGGVPNTITFSRPLKFTPNISSNTSVQIISFPTLGSPDYTTTANMTALDWNGNVGGVLAFNVDGIFTLAHDISADGDGFRGGSTDKNQTNGNCEDNVFISSWTSRAYKGEGIYKNTSSSFEAARGKILNGGGGGSSHNGGGGGGGNFTAGGDGGVGWGCRNTSGRSSGGLGGIALSAHISSARVFLGGGAGAGERNNGWNTSGGDGGGIILIKADEVRTSGFCGGISISANGEDALNIGNDGAGGAGAGGSIVIEVNTWNISGTCPINIEANGGDGGNVNSGTHGGGGGGGQGVVIYSIAVPTTNTTTTTNNGTGGCSNNSNPCNSVAGTGSGTNGSGISGGSTGGPLPILLQSFDAELIKESLVELKWVTSTELNNSHFIVERSQDGYDWEEVAKVLAEGNSVTNIDYVAYDNNPLYGVSYYRLKQVDFDGTLTIFKIKTIINEQELEASIYPNPTKDILNVVIEDETSFSVKLYNSVGQLMELPMTYSGNKMTLNTTAMDKGFYLVVIENGNTSLTRTVIIE
ncbi:MAG: T9SS type A sorting domain-containing protein [Flavobacteriales bacterium]|jgi:hypothetical protein|nr:T9SS type A sorting domain-containing protein [Flavobacteriales bacterium]